MKQIVLEEKVYDHLDEVKRAISRSASFNTVVKEMIRRTAGSITLEKGLYNEYKRHQQRRGILSFIQELREFSLISEHIDELDLLVPILLLINDDWERLKAMVDSKVEFLDQAMKNLDDTREEFLLLQKKKYLSQNTNGVVPSGAESVKSSTSTGRKSAKDIRSTKAAKRKSKRK